MQEKIIFWSLDMIPKMRVILEGGNVILGTSDTVFGLLAMPTREGFNALNAIKGRSEKPYLIITGSPEKALDLCAQKDQQELLRCMQSCWPGPITMIVKAKKSVPEYMKSKEGTIAIRVPDHAGFKMLLKEMPYLFSTSANLTGQPVPHSVQDLDPVIVDQCALVIIEKKENKKSVLPSTIIDCTQMPFKVMREGAVSIEELKEKCEDIF